MSVIINQNENFLEMQVSGQLSADDYTHPETGILARVHNYATSCDHMRIVVTMSDFTGWESGAEKNEWTLLDEVKQKPCRLAIVGASAAIKTTISFMSTFMHNPTVRCFDAMSEAPTIVLEGSQLG